MLKILIIGHARHGKDTVAGILAEDFGYRCENSSTAAAKIFLFDALKDRYGYTSFEECFEDRVNHRKEWYDAICEYNKEDRARLAKAIMADNDIYVGMRSGDEIDECLWSKVFDIVIGVYDPRKPLESKDSFSIDMDKYADIVIVNNGTISDLIAKINLLKFL